MKANDWSEARAAMLLDPGVANLNTGSFGPLPRVVFERVTELRRRLAEEPMDLLLRQAPPLLRQARERLASYLGCDPRRLVFTPNVTAAINIVAASFRLAAPGEVLLTDHEYGAMHWCWERAAIRQGLTLRTFPLPAMPSRPEEIVEAFCQAFTPRSRLVFFSHVLSPTGMVLPAGAICKEARRRGIISVVDGAHAPGLVPIQVESLSCDIYTGNCHKWVLAPTGSGFLCLPADSDQRLQPLQVSWGWHHDRTRLDEPDEHGSTPRIRSFEFEGTRDPCAWLTIPTAIDFQDSLGVDRIRTRIAALAAGVRQRFSRLPQLQLATPPEPELHAAMTAYRLPKGSVATELRKQLWETYRIEVPIFERPDGLYMRVSTHFYNTEEEVERLSTALEKILK